MAAIELKPQVDEELSRYAQQQGVSKDDVVNKVLLEYLEDREDYDAAVNALKNKTGITYSLDEVRRELGLDD